MDNHAAAGAINSTATDMAKWLEFQVGDGNFRGATVLSTESLRETQLGQAIHRESPLGAGYPHLRPVEYAMGWHVIHYGEERLLMHTGSFRGHAAAVMLLPERRFDQIRTGFRLAQRSRVLHGPRLR